jgi:hypothetical protein
MADWQNHSQFTLEQWEYFLKSDPEINIGVLCGHPSGLLLIDIDNKEAQDAFARLEREHSGQGKNGGGNYWRFTTGKGERYIFLSPDSSVSFKIPTGTGHYIEILGDGRQSVVPPSIHPTGRKYRWVNGFTPRDFRASNAPDFIRSGASGGAGEPVDSERQNWAEVLGAGVAEGDRNNYMTRLCGHLLAPQPLPESEAWFWLRLYNKHYVHPPVDERELEKIFRSILKREQSGESRIKEIMAEYNVSRKQAVVYMESWGENG